MKRVLSSQLPAKGHPTQLGADESRHVLQVLRLRNGDPIEVIDGQGHAVLARLLLRGKDAWVELDDRPELNPGPTTIDPARAAVIPVVLELAVLKGDAMEWAIEKAVELGIQKLIPLLTAHTVVQMDRKGPEAFRERWQKIADQALKQCGRLQKLELALPIPLVEYLEAEPSHPSAPRLWFDESATHQAPDLALWLSQPRKLTGIRLLVGPEGGWSQIEKSLLSPSTERISLGPLILRAETAALYGISLTSAYFRSRNS